jgi:UDP-4-amino-4-deoxy-L-arabinose-oxoglutarate aminotransferase
MGLFISHSKPYISDLERKYVDSVLNKGMLIKGDAYNDFRIKVAEYLNVESSTICASGKNSLCLILKAIKAKDGDKKNEVILPSYVCRSVVEAIEIVGFVPVFCDISESWVSNSKNIIEKVTEKTIAAIIVNLFGIMVDIEELKSIDILLIDDNCQSFHSNNGNRCDFSFYSFNATKCLTTIEGGLATVSNEDYREHFAVISKGFEEENGYNELSSAIGLAQLSQYDDFLKKRSSIAEYYIGNINKDLVEKIEKVSNCTYFRFPLCYKTEKPFNSIRHEFEQHGVAVRKGVDLLLHRLYGFNDSDFIVTENTFDETISIPIYPAMTDDEVRYITVLVNEILC